MIAVNVAAEVTDILGEGPAWNTFERALYWVDAFAPAIRRFSPANGRVDSWPMPADIGSIAFCTDGRLLGAMRTGFALLDLARNAAEIIADPLIRDRRLMLNDGKCDRRGRFWCGTVHSDFVGRSAELYRLDPDRSVRKMDEGFIIGNGIAFSPDDRTMYFADSRDETVYAYDFDVARGAIANRRVFFSTQLIAGRVDGATVDRNGNYWCALVHGGAVACISPEGKMIERIPLPVRHPTMCTFGGAALDVLYVTTATALLPEKERRDWPLAGRLFAITGTGARGIAEPVFGAGAVDHVTIRR